MGSDSSSSSGGGIGICGATFIVFLVLKLLGHIDWSWWWVTAPLWIPAAIVGAIVLIVALIVGVMALVEHRRDKKRREEYRQRHCRQSGRSL